MLTTVILAAGQGVRMHSSLPKPLHEVGGRAMAVCYDGESLASYAVKATEVSGGHPILLDRFLDGAVELDLDLIADGDQAVVGGILQHIEEAGIHSGDSAAILPPLEVSAEHLEEMRGIARRLALRLGVVGLMNVQFALHEGQVYVLEVNPRASRTVPFIAKAVGVPLVKIAARVMAGEKLADLGFVAEPKVPVVAVKAPVFPFKRLPNVDPVLGPEMKSTGEVMGLSAEFGHAVAKAWVAAGNRLPESGSVFLSVPDLDKPALVPVARRLAGLGFELVATEGTASFLESQGLAARKVRKVWEGRPNVADEVINGEIDLVINTPIGREPHSDDAVIRKTALRAGVPVVTTLSGALAVAEAIAALRKNALSVSSLQEIHARA
ncbi:MAG TPA: ATP-grasp domain-containing protein [Thermoanaerobaculia bacterium]|nr:ATP-grasp domain-containing protein [Thermoanaerobaculia bacterium]